MPTRKPLIPRYLKLRDLLVAERDPDRRARLERRASEPLTDREQRFVELVANGRAVSAAYGDAGYSGTGSSLYQLLARPRVVRALEQALDGRLARFDVSTDRMVDALAGMSFFDLRELLDRDGRLKPMDEVPEQALFAIAGLEVSEDADGRVRHKLRLVDRRACIESLARLLGIIRPESERRKLKVRMAYDKTADRMGVEVETH